MQEKLNAHLHLWPLNVECEALLDNKGRTKIGHVQLKGAWEICHVFLKKWDTKLGIDAPNHMLQTLSPCRLDYVTVELDNFVMVHLGSC